MITKILLIVLSVGVLSTVPGCTLDFVNLREGAGVGTSQDTDQVYRAGSSSRKDPWGDDWQYRQGRAYRLSE
jgi:hypothetical protein